MAASIGAWRTLAGLSTPCPWCRSPLDPKRRCGQGVDNPRADPRAGGTSGHTGLPGEVDLESAGMAGSGCRVGILTNCSLNGHGRALEVGRAQRTLVNGAYNSAALSGSPPLSESSVAAASWRDYLEMTKPARGAADAALRAGGHVRGDARGAAARRCPIGPRGDRVGLRDRRPWSTTSPTPRSDGRMARTRDRPVAVGRVRPLSGGVFAAVLGIAGMAVLLIWVNPLTAWAETWASWDRLRPDLHAVLEAGGRRRNIVIGGLFGAAPPLFGGRRSPTPWNSAGRHPRAHHLRLGRRRTSGRSPSIGARTTKNVDVADCCRSPMAMPIRGGRSSTTRSRFAWSVCCPT